MKTLWDNVLYEWTYRPMDRYGKPCKEVKREKGYFAGRYSLGGWPVMRTVEEPHGYMVADPFTIKEDK